MNSQIKDILLEQLINLVNDMLVVFQMINYFYYVKIILIY